MGQDCASWFPPQELDSLSPKPSSFAALFQSGQQDTLSLFKKGVANMVSVHGMSPVYAQMPHSHLGRENQPHGWFHGLPRFQQALMPSQKLCPKEFAGGLSQNHLEVVMSKAECNQKRFLVFDQSGDQTSLIFSSGIGKPFRSLTSWTPKPLVACDDVKGHSLRTKQDLNLDLGIVPRDESDENNGPDVQSEMHEDTEELNALLYSDDESDYSDDDEVTSSGHSPSTIASHDVQEASVGSTEEVASSVGHTKKRKMLDARNDETISLLNTSNYMQLSNSCYGDESDAESCCGQGGNTGFVKSFLSSGNKRMK